MFDMDELLEQAGKAEAPAQVRGFARRMRNLYLAMAAEGFSREELKELFMAPMVIHLNGPDLPEVDGE